ncbi:MAG: DNA polymerase I, partial [Candidatus Fonsibacter sp.]
MKNLGPGDLLYLIDGSGYIFRAFYALPPLTRKSDGMPVGAVSGFCNMLYKFLYETKKTEIKPTHIAVIFDSARKNFRNEIYPDYKANRSETPEELIPQFDFIRQAVQAFSLPSIEMENYEADDLIATYTKEAVSQGAKVKI